MASALTLVDQLLSKIDQHQSHPTHDTDSKTTESDYAINIDNPLFTRRDFKILCCGLGHPYTPKQVAHLQSKGYHITLLPECTTRDEAEALLYKHVIKEQHNDYDAVLNVWLRFGQTVRNEKLPNLKVISFVSSGFSVEDAAYCREHGIRATNTPFALNETVADLAVGLCLATCRQFFHCARYAKQAGDGKAAPKTLYRYCLNPDSKDLHRSTVGIVGLGAVGRQISKRLHFGFDCKCIYFNGEGKQRKAYDTQYGASMSASLEALLKESDFVIAICPLTDNNKHMFNERAFRMMKKDAVFINVGRGGLCDHAALMKALKEGWIGAAGLDVQDPEPLPSEHELWNLPNCTILPHIGSSTRRTRESMVDTALDNMLRVLNGLPCTNLAC